MGSHDDWLGIYDSAVGGGVDLAALSCPNCAHRALKLVYVYYDDGYAPDRGTAALWCDSCLMGITVGRVRFLGGYPRVLSEKSRRADGGPIPNFEIVIPE